MQTAHYPFEFGELTVEYEGDVLYKLRVQRREPKVLGMPSDFSDHVLQEIVEYLEGERRDFDIKYELKGTDFQKDVWHALEKISYGSVCTYGEIAKWLGRPGAARAVGNACHNNPIWLIVPCHRVIASGGGLGGYGGMLDMKAELLKRESERR